MIEMFHYPFFINALLIGCLSGLAAGCVGAFIVIRRMSFLAGSISHAAFGGIGFSVMMGTNPLLGALGAGVLSALFIGYIRYYFKQHEDILIGAVWSIGMSLGILFIHFSPGYGGDLMGYLFGNILFSTRQDVVVLAILNAFIFGTVTLLYRAFQAITFDSESAEIQNLAVKPLYMLFLILVSITSIILIKTVGIILVIALLTLPAATALALSKNLKTVILIASLTGATSCTLGLIASFYLDLPTSPLIIFQATLFFLLAIIYKR